MTLNIIIRMDRADEKFRGENPERTQLDRIEAGLHLLREELQTMAQTQQDQDTQLTADVAALGQKLTDFETAVAAEIASIKSSPAAADPVVATAITNLEGLTARLVSDTAAATPAPPAPDTPPAAPADGIQTITG
jgi:hypothetical protein